MPCFRSASTSACARDSRCGSAICSARAANTARTSARLGSSATSPGGTDGPRGVVGGTSGMAWRAAAVAELDGSGDGMSGAGERQAQATKAVARSGMSRGNRFSWDTTTAHPSP